MKKIFAGTGKIILGVFTVAVIGLMALMTYETLGRVYPEEPIKQLWGMVLFSGGTVAWFVILLFASRSGQRPLALLMFVLSLVGEVIYAAADVFMGGQAWVAVDPRLGEYVLWTFIAMTFAHGSALYAHFILDPERIASVEMEAMQDQAQDEALKKAQEMVAFHLDSMAETLAKRTMVDVMTGLSLPLPENVVDGRVVEATTASPGTLRAASPAPAAQPTKRGILPVSWPGWTIFGKDEPQDDEAEPEAEGAQKRPAISFVGDRDQVGYGRLLVRVNDDLEPQEPWYRGTADDFRALVNRSGAYGGEWFADSPATQGRPLSLDDQFVEDIDPNAVRPH